MIDLRSLLKISRPRFWLYVFGPYIVGLAAAAGSGAGLLRPAALLFGLYFLLPANLLIYGTNDIADYETDKLNPKKAGYETVVHPEFRRRLAFWIIGLNIPFIVAAALMLRDSMPALLGFLFFSIFYSLRPIRAKAVPFLDSAFNVLYVFPGIFSFHMIAGQYPPFAAVLAAALWTAAMHAYSAVPDIDSDSRAGISTIATAVGKRLTLVLCGLLFAASALIAFQFLSYLSIVLGIAYVGLVLVSLMQYEDERLFRLYKAFPLINAVSGALIFWYAALTLL